MSKQRYLYVEGQKIPVSEELYQVYYHFARKERYFSEDLKREKLLYCRKAIGEQLHYIELALPR